MASTKTGKKSRKTAKSPSKPSPAPSKKGRTPKTRVLEAEEILDPETDPEASELDSEDREPSGEEIEALAVDGDTPAVSRARALEPLEEVESSTQLTAISPRDPLRRYLEETHRHPLLTPEEEFALALKLRDTGDLDAARKLVQANLRLVVKIAFEYRSITTHLMDLVQEGNIGLMKAVSKFDPTKGARLGYYASWWIRSYILKYLLDNFRLVRVGTTQAQKKLFYHLMKEKERLEAQGLLAGPKLLAERLEVREKDVVEMQQRLSSQGVEVPIDTPTDPDQTPGRTLSATLADPSEPVDQVLARKEWLAILAEHLPAFRELLSEKELKLLEERLLADAPKTLQEVADQYGLTRERARQIEVKVVQKLREFLKKHLRDGD